MWRHWRYTRISHFVIVVTTSPEKLIWWGEAPEPLYDFDEAAGVGSPNTWATPSSSPSRGLSCEQGEMHRSAGPWNLSRANLKTNDTADPRLGTRIA